MIAASAVLLIVGGTMGGTIAVKPLKWCIIIAGLSALDQY